MNKIESRAARRFFLAIGIVSWLSLHGLAEDARSQDGVSSSSVSMFRAGLIPHPDSIVLEDFFNYHKHDIPVPRDGKTIGLDVRFGSEVAAGQAEVAYLQVGLATKRFDENAHIPPLNVAIVVDRSGSMSGERIAKVKQALSTFINDLRDVDRVAIITFSETAEALVASQEITNVALVEHAIDSIVADGSTNISAGLFLGYEQVEANFDDNKMNRVILLTDGQANRGITDSEEIAAASKAYNDKGIDLSTIGVGSNFNYQLMRQLARAGRGLIHFVGDDEDINKVFVEELQSLLTQAAQRVTVEIEYPEELRLVRAYGYTPQYGEGRVTYSLDNLNADSTQVLPLRFDIVAPKDVASEIPVQVTLKYRDVATHTDVEEPQSTTLVFRPSKEPATESLIDEDVRRSIAIAELADSFRETSQLVDEQEYDEAAARVKEGLAIAISRYPMTLNEDVSRVIEMGEGYRDALLEHIENTKAEEKTIR